ncbi:MAG: hypothetical protein OXI86_07770, partial [Candidatus Poribacteria bacterium]|nr:hypothetical protein [Candidatus Poribacteria bacterium]
ILACPILRKVKNTSTAKDYMQLPKRRQCFLLTRLHSWYILKELQMIDGWDAPDSLSIFKSPMDRLMRQSDHAS